MNEFNEVITNVTALITGLTLMFKALKALVNAVLDENDTDTPKKG